MEFMVALALFGVAASALGAAFRAGISAWERGERASRLDQEARAALQLMARELRNALPVPGAAAAGDERSLVFHMYRERGRGSTEADPAVVRVSYRLEAAGAEEDGRLWRTEERLNGSGPHRAVSRREVTSLPTSIRFQFAYAAESAGSGPRWEDRWDRRDALPPLVRVRLDLEDGEEAEGFTKTLWVPSGQWMPWNG